MWQDTAERGWPPRVWGRIGLATGLSALVALLVLQSPTCVDALAPLDSATAAWVADSLELAGMTAQRESAILSHPGGFSYKIGFGCNGVIPAGISAIAILAAGGCLRRRMLGAGLAFVAGLALNLIRLLSLFYVGVRFPAQFELAHSVVWPALTVLSSAGLFSLWRAAPWQRRRLMPAS